MDAAIPYVIELSLLIALQIAIYAGVRSLVLYGKHSQKLVALVGCVGLCMLIGLTGFKSYQRLSISSADATPSGYISQPNFSANLTPAMRENAGRNYVRQVYLDSGRILDYEIASGEKVPFAPSENLIEMRADKIANKNKRRAMDSEMLGKAMVWGLMPFPVMLFAFLFARREYKNLVAHHGFQPIIPRFQPKTFAEVEGFVNMLLGACEDAKLHTTLEMILSQTDDGRKAMIRGLLTELRANQAPRELIEAFICLLDNEVAEKAYVVIHKCERPPNMQPPSVSPGNA